MILMNAITCVQMIFYEEGVTARFLEAPFERPRIQDTDLVNIEYAH